MPCLKYESYKDSLLNSLAPQLLEITVAPSVAARFSATKRS